jgi:predicted nucleic acid-binding protein
VKYLLDVNALLAWRHATANGHDRFHAWAKAEGFDALATCALAELGFLRVSMQVFRLSRAEAQTALADMKRHAGGFVSIAPSPELDSWATRPAQTSDAYLSQIAAANGLRLATFDTAIPGAVQINARP